MPEYAGFQEFPDSSERLVPGSARDIDSSFEGVTASQVTFVSTIHRYFFDTIF